MLLENENIGVETSMILSDKHNDLIQNRLIESLQLLSENICDYNHADFIAL